MQEAVKDWTYGGKKLIGVPDKCQNSPARNSDLSICFARSWLFARHLGHHHALFAQRKKGLGLWRYTFYEFTLVVYFRGISQPSPLPPRSSVPDRTFRVLAVATHPVQYPSPNFCALANHAQVDFKVAYCSIRGARQLTIRNSINGMSLCWMVTIGWKYQAMDRARNLLWGLYSSGLWRLILQAKFDAVPCVRICQSLILDCIFGFAIFGERILCGVPTARNPRS